MSGLTLQFLPHVPWYVVILLGVAAAFAALPGIIVNNRGAWLRAIALGLVVLALAGPVMTHEQRSLIPNIVALVVDRSGSQDIGERLRQTDTARDELARRIKGLGATELRVVEAGKSSGDDGTRLFQPLSEALSDVPVDRIGGVIVLTDGIVNDIPAKASALGFEAPLHVLVTGHPDEKDRRIEVVEAPRYGLLRKSTQVRFRIVDTGPDMPPVAQVTLRLDGEEVSRTSVVPGELSTLEVPLTHAGTTVAELEVEAVTGELSPLNNRTVLKIEGIREKMRVLLVSGEPNAGERTWRNLLKADANVELVHFTILRPPTKGDGTPVEELSLIAFPVQQLFETQIRTFDLIIFDRYAQEGLLPPEYFDNITEFVRSGGAVLLASGSDYASENSLWGTGLADILPAAPTGNVIYQPFRPLVTDTGQRHPVTRDLPGGGSQPPAWGQWFTTVETAVKDGKAILSGAQALPLLVLSRQGKGRVALLLSDHAWLWARGYDGGGPHLDLLRRLSHWLMKEPDLEEEALRAGARGSNITIERQTMSDTANPVELTGPDGSRIQLALKQEKPGLWRADYTAGTMGLWKVGDGALQTLVSVGPDNPEEYRELVSTVDRLLPLANQTGGSAGRLDNGSGLAVPVVRSVGEGSSYGGNGWLGLKRSKASQVYSVTTVPLLAGLLGLALLIGMLAVVWRREGR